MEANLSHFERIMTATAAAMTRFRASLVITAATLTAIDGCVPPCWSNAIYT
jgi:hypothetical protein